MISGKVIIQSLSVFAVGGSAIAGGAYKINNDIQVEKAKKNEFKKKIEAKTAELNLATETVNNSQIEIQTVVSQIKENGKEKIKVKAVIEELKKTKKTLSEDIAKIIEDEKTKTDEVNTTNQKKQELSNNYGSVSSLIYTKTSLLTKAKTDQKAAETALNNAAQDKADAEREKTTAEQKKVTDDKAVVALNQTLQQDEQQEASTKAAYDAESAKPACTPVVSIPKTLTEAEGEEAQQTNKEIEGQRNVGAEEVQTQTKCAISSGTAIKDNTFQNPETLTQLNTTKQAAIEKTKATKELLKAAEALVVFTNADLKTKTDTLTKATEALESAKTTKDNEDAKAKEAEKELNDAKKNQILNATQIGIKSKENTKAQKELTALTSEKQQKEQSLTQTTSSIKDKEREFSDLESEITPLKEKETTLNKQLSEQKEIKEMLEAELIPLKISTNDSN